MKCKVSIIVLAVLLVVSVVYGVVATIGVRDALNDASEWEMMHGEVLGNYKELSKKYETLVEKDLSTPPVIKAIANLIDDNASITTYNESVVNIVVSETADIKSKVEEQLIFIKSSLNTYKYKSCVISVVDTNGKCVYGWTVLANGTSYAFLSE